MPALSPLTGNQSPFQLELRTSLEGTEPEAFLFSPQLWFHFKDQNKFSVDVKLPFWFVNDPKLGRVSNFSDPMFTLSWLVLEKENLFLDVFGGMRVGINHAKAKGALGDLPMDYQSSLGTTDIILGAKFTYQEFTASVALQTPVWQYNLNKNVVAKYAENPQFIPVLEYNRKADLAVRIDKRWLVKQWYFQIGLLPIYHLANDELLSTQNTGYITIDGSKGLTLNIPFAMAYQLNDWLFGLNGGFPVITRDERPDGLTRKFVIQPRIVYNL